MARVQSPRPDPARRALGGCADAQKRLLLMAGDGHSAGANAAAIRQVAQGLDVSASAGDHASALVSTAGATSVLLV